MKKQLLITLTVIGSAGLMAFGYANFNGQSTDKVNFQLIIQSRDGETVTRENLLKADNATDIVLEPADWSRHPVQTMTVIIYENEKEIKSA